MNPLVCYSQSRHRRKRGYLNNESLSLSQQRKNWKFSWCWEQQRCAKARAEDVSDEREKRIFSVSTAHGDSLYGAEDNGKTVTAFRFLPASLSSLQSKLSKGLLAYVLYRVRPFYFEKQREEGEERLKRDEEKQRRTLSTMLWAKRHRVDLLSSILLNQTYLMRQVERATS